MSRSKQVRSPLSPHVLPAALLCLLFVGCGNQAAPAPQEPAGQTAEACQPGDTKPADDGCNTCSCRKGEWACTKKACL